MPEHDAIARADSHLTKLHASEHTDGTDDIQNATGSQKGLATAAQITKLNGITAGATDDTTVNAHIADTTDAHDASAISFVPAGTIAATNVQAAIEEAASESGGSDDQTAAEVPFTPTGAIAATNVQTALAELDTEKATTGSVTTVQTNLDNHTTDTTDAHDASAISVLDAATQYTATNVEDALAEVLDGLQAHEADSSDAHDASAISFSPTGTIAATDVQAAIAEVASEAAGGSSEFTKVTLGSDVSNSTTSFADVTGFSFAVTSGTIYFFEADIIYTSAISTTGSSWGVNGPTKTALGVHVWWAGSASSQSAQFQGNYDAGSVSLGSATAAGEGNLCTMRGFIQPSASGTFIIRFKSEVAASAITAKAGSTLRYRS